MNNYVKIGFLTAAAAALITACSTEKNTAINREFHSLNARYNGYFNANELLNQSMMTYRANLDENFYDLVPLEPVPNETEVEAFYSPIDTAIAKCKKVITDHSMPSNDRPSKKNAEHNRWIDENWTTIGIASFYRRDYEGAMKSFKFVKKFYSNDPSLFVGELWMAKTNIKQGRYTDAKFNLDNLQAALDRKTGGGESGSKPEKTKAKKSKASKLNNAGSSSKKTEKPAEFPKKIRFDFERTKADLAIKQADYPKAIEFLEESLNHAKKSEDKGRVHFVLGQLYERQGNNELAVKHYRKSRKHTIPFKMSFNARLKACLLDGGEKTKKQLKKMLRDAKNAEFKDQIYYTLAEIELREGNEPLAVEYLTQSAFYSTTNARQKGMAYEKLGDLRFAKRDYVHAQKYYDSCAIAIPEDYPNAEGIRNKAEKLADLVVAVETAYYEDSVQRVARMDPEEQEKFIKKVIQDKQAEEKARKQREAEKLRELQANTNAFQQDIGKSGGGYWGNPKSMAEGYDEFVRLWGQRPNEDHWRRKEKTVVPNFSDIEGDSLNPSIDTLVAEKDISPDSLTVEKLTANLPQSEDDFAASNARLLEALYDAGIIYKEQLNELDLAKKQFHDVLDRKVESDYNLMSAFQLYKLYESMDPTAAAEQKSYILNNYPNSDYANYLRDPDYFIKKKERDALAEQEYVTVLERYGRGLYYPVLSKAESVIVDEKDNVYRPKYMLLKAMCLGQTTENKNELLPVLEQLVAEYPETSEAERGAEMIDVIKNGYSKNIEANFDKKSIYTYDEKSRQVVLIFLGKDDNLDLSKNKVADFNREFFPKSKIKVTSSLFGMDQNVIMLTDFESENDAKEYVRKYRETRKYLLDLQKAKTLIITGKNLKVLFETKELEQYDLFYDEYY